MNTAVKKWIPATFMALVITVASSIPAQKLEKAPVHVNDKMAHVVVYACGGMALRHALSSSPMTILAGAAFGAFDENYQRLVPGRETSLLDWIADLIGVSLGTLFYVGIQKIRRFFPNRNA
jgi:VanZ family protein